MEEQTFGERLKAIREGSLVRTGPEIGVRELARRSNVNHAQISQAEKNKAWVDKLPSPEIIRALADGLGVTFRQLVGDKVFEALFGDSIYQEPSPTIRQLADIGERVVAVVQESPAFIIPEERIRVIDDKPEDVELVELQIHDRFAANYLSASHTQVHDRVLVPRHLRDRAERPVLVVATGDCLAMRRILSGDLLIVDAARKHPQDGEIVAFYFRGEAAVKIFHRFDDRLEFRPSIDTYPTIVVRLEDADDLHIVGVMVARVPRPDEDDY